MYELVLQPCFFSWRKWRGPPGWTHTLRAGSWPRRPCPKETGESARAPWRDGQTRPSARCRTRAQRCCALGLETRCVWVHRVAGPARSLRFFFFCSEQTCARTQRNLSRVYGMIQTTCALFFVGGEAVWPCPLHLAGLWRRDISETILNTSYFKV